MPLLGRSLCSCFTMVAAATTPLAVAACGVDNFADAPTDAAASSEGSTGDAGTSTDAADAPADAGPLALVQHVTFTFSVGAASQLAQFSQPVTEGNFLAAVMVSNNPGASAVFSVSDLLGNTWKSTPFHRCTLSNVGSRIWYVESSKPGIDVVTVTQSVDAGTGQLGLALFEYSGLAPSNTLDVEHGGCAIDASGAMASGAITTSHRDLLLGVFADPCGSGNMVAGPTWTPEDVNTTYYYLFEDRQGDGGVPPGSYEATATNPKTSQCWVASVSGFRVK